MRERERARVRREAGFSRGPCGDRYAFLNLAFLDSVSQSVISRSRPALTPLPARNPAPPLPVFGLIFHTLGFLTCAYAHDLDWFVSPLAPVRAFAPSNAP